MIEHLCVHEIFERQAASSPDGVALTGGGHAWSYKALNERANQIAAYLRDKGVGRESVVAVDLERSAETIAVLLGILKAGGAYAPLDPADPAPRRAAVLEQLAPTWIFRSGDLAASRSEQRENVPNCASAESLAYIVFTSGSTGIPKGVQVEHRSVVRLVRGADYVALDDRQVFLQLAPLAFDASTFEIWGALLNGSTLAVAPAGLLSLSEIGRIIVSCQVTTLWLTAGLFHAMVDQQLQSLAGVSQLLAGGDVLSPRHVRKLLDFAPGLRLINGYGPTEGTTFTCCYTVPHAHRPDAPVPIGAAVSGTSVYLLDENLQPVPEGAAGELFAGGAGIARGYLRQPELTAERFLSDPFSPEKDARMYRTGDLARRRADGSLEFLGRADGQVKIRGFRVEPGDIEAALNAHAAVGQSMVVVTPQSAGEKRLTAYVTARNGVCPTGVELRNYLRTTLPAYLIPADFRVVEALPLTPGGKLDRQAWRAPAGQDLLGLVRRVWERVLGITAPDVDAAFFDLGGSSLQLLQVQGYLEQELRANLTVPELFRFPTIRTLAEHLAGGSPEPLEPIAQPAQSPAIAIVGMAARLPGAKNIRQFWQNLRNGVESITFFEENELAAGGPGTVNARPVLDGVDLFDAEYFGILPKEAETMDPQHRVFLECSVEAWEDAGYVPGGVTGVAGVFAGCSPNSYFLHNLCASREFVEDYTGSYQVGNYQTMLGTSSDFLATRVSYKLNLTGPSITLGTACSTSLVAICQACDSLMTGQCEVALAGGVSITFPQERGYTYQEGGIVSPDGHCRAFDAKAAGTVFGSGCGVVVLKRLDQAVAAGDSIYAVIKGWSVNNDGSAKMGFTAPSVHGQAQAIRRAQEMAGFSPESITYVEAHGTATPLGDPVEVEALTQAFRAGTGARQFCALGTAKTNVGHLDAAAGVTGLIKAALSVRFAELPPTVHFEGPNPRIDFASSPFYVNDKLQPWTQDGQSRRAGVSAFGVGGTNAHVVLEQAPAVTAEPHPGADIPLLLSARTPAALEETVARIEAHLQAEPGLDKADAAWTLLSGRKRFEHRCMLLAGRRIFGRAERDPEVAFVFPGQGAQYPGMGRELYRNLPYFREQVDECAALLRPHGVDLHEALQAAQLDETRLAQPALFAVEYALAKQWMRWGIQPRAMAGHSVGEFVAAALAGVFSLEDALALVAARGHLMQALPEGAMLSVRVPEAEARALLTPEVSLAAVNGPAQCVLAGPRQAIEAIEDKLGARRIACRRLRTARAFHSGAVDEIVGPLLARIEGMRLHPPQIPYVSTVSGDWITTEQATDPKYWARHCRETVQFSAAVKSLARQGRWCVLETGPGQTLTTLVRQHTELPNALTAIASLSDGTAKVAELDSVLAAAGRLWLQGAEPGWEDIYEGRRRRRVSLPATAFDPKRFWVDPPKAKSKSKSSGPEKAQPAPVAAGRRDRLTHELLALVAELSGLEVGPGQEQTTFLEMGFDSLFLTQVTQALEAKYRVKIRFAQLLDDLSTPEQLAAYLDATLPSEPQAPAAVPVTAPGGWEQLFKDQLQAFADLTARQIAALKGGPAPPQPVPSKPVKFEAFGPYKPAPKSPAGALTPAPDQVSAAFIGPVYAADERIQTADAVPSGPPGRSAGRRGIPPAMERLCLPHPDRALPGFEALGRGRQRIHRPAERLRGDAVRPRVRILCARRSRGNWNGHRDRPADAAMPGKVADLLCEMTGMERATFCNTGSEAVMAAMRLARTVTGRNKIVYFAGDYHGAFDEVLVKAAGRPGGPPKSRPIAPGHSGREGGERDRTRVWHAQPSLESIRSHAARIGGGAGGAGSEQASQSAAGRVFAGAARDHGTVRDGADLR